MNADEIVRALRCRKTGKRKCARCPYTAEMSCTEAAMDDAASLIESQQAQLATEPLTCDGCKNDGKWESEYEYGYPSPCTYCKRRASDNYARKPEGSTP